MVWVSQENFFRLSEISIESSIIVLLILTLKLIVGNKISGRWQYRLWFILLLSLLMPYASMSTSITLPVPDVDVKPVEYVVYNNSTTHNRDKSDDIIVLNQSYSQSSKIKIENGFNLFWFIWIMGLIIISVYTLIINITFAIKVKLHSTRIHHSPLNDLINFYATDLWLTKTPKLIRTNCITQPALYGIINPKLLIPTDFEKKLSIDELRMVILHEFYHVKRMDLFVNWIASILQLIHWFNPILWYGFSIMRQDREIACDEAVLSYLKGDQKKEYGGLLLKLISKEKYNYRHANIANIHSNKPKIKRRIIMISKFNKQSKKARLLILSIIIALSFVVTSLALDTEPTTQRIVDNIDLEFVNDPEVLGEWESVDFVDEIDDFEVDKQQCKDTLYMTKLIFLGNGELKFNDDSDRPWFKWTKGVVTHSGDQTASEYIIKEIDGSRYLFFQWKSGDYVLRGMKPSYYVLKEVQ